MGKYDYVDRRYFGKPERMAELLSKGLYRGRLRVLAKELVEADYVNPEEYEGDLRLFFKAMQCRYDKRKLDALFASGELEGLSWDAQCAIAVHLNVKGLVQKVVEEEEKMCKAYRDLVKDWKAEGRVEGEVQGVLESIKNLMQTMKLSAEEAMNALLVPEEDREMYLAKLQG